MRTYYDFFEIDVRANQNEILEAYRKKVLEFHPDRGGSSEEFIKVRKYYQTLSNPVLREKYDLWVIKSNRQHFENTLQLFVVRWCRNVELRKLISNILSSNHELYLNIKALSSTADAARIIKKCILQIQNNNPEYYIPCLEFDSTCNKLILNDFNSQPTKELNSDNDEKITSPKGKFSYHALVLVILLTVVIPVLLWFVCINELKTSSVSMDECVNIKTKELNESDSKEGEIADEAFPDCYQNDNRKKLYDALSEDYDMGTFEQFCSDIQDDRKRRKLYDATINDYDFGDYDSFSRQLLKDCSEKRNVLNTDKSVGGVSGNPSYEGKTEIVKKDYQYREPQYEKPLNTQTLSPKRKMNSSKYKEVIYKTGDIPYHEYFGEGIYDINSLSQLTIDNYSEHDAVVLLVSTGGNVIRNNFIKCGSSFTMKKIPNNRYLIKVMFGNSWNSKKNNGVNFPSGGFMKNVSYMQSKKNDLFDFTPNYSSDGIEYPTYSVTLHKVRNGNMSTAIIDENDFFNN